MGLVPSSSQGAVGFGERILVPAPTGVKATDAAALQTAFNAVSPAGDEVLLAAGDYNMPLATNLNVPYPTTITGCGAGTYQHYITSITFNNVAGDCLTIAAGGCLLRDFAVVDGSGAQASTLIVFGTADGQNNIKAHTVSVINGAVGIDIRYGIGHSIGLGSSFVNTGGGDCCILVRNLANVDQGDHTITEVFFEPSGINDVIRWESAGGLRIDDVKSISGGVANFLHLHPTSTLLTPFTADIFLQNSSIEGFTNAAVYGAAGYQVNNIVVTDNELSANSLSSTYVTYFASNYQTILIDANVLNANNTGSGINIMIDGSLGVGIGKNCQRGADVGIEISASSGAVHVSLQEWDRGNPVTTYIVDNSDSAFSSVQVGKIDHRYRSSFTGLGSTSVYTPVWKIGSVGTGGGGACIVNWTVSGLTNNIGPYLLVVQATLIPGASSTTIATATLQSIGPVPQFQVTASGYVASFELAESTASGAGGTFGLSEIEIQGQAYSVACVGFP